jgi:hypothetical protein
LKRPASAVRSRLWTPFRSKDLQDLNSKPPRCGGFYIFGKPFGTDKPGLSLQNASAPLPHLFTICDKEGILYAIGAAMIVYGCLTSSKLEALFSIFHARFLGRTSFCLSLFHVPLLYTVFAAIYVAQAPVTPGVLAALFLIFVCGSVRIAYLGTLMVDEPVLRLNAGVRRMVSATEYLRGNRFLRSKERTRHDRSRSLRDDKQHNASEEVDEQTIREWKPRRRLPGNRRASEETLY